MTMTSPALGTSSGTVVPLGALGPGGGYLARNRHAIRDVTGEMAAELGLAPRLYVTRAMTALRRARTLPRPQRATALRRAAEIFTEEKIDGLDYETYRHTVARVSGVPLSVVHEATDAIAESAANGAAHAFAARPDAAVLDWSADATRRGAAVWTRRGDVFAVNAAGNHPGPHGLWLEALALGYRVAIRPSRREPFTPHRLVTALRRAGFGDDHVMLLPAAHDVADTMMGAADLGLVYGGDDVVRKYQGSTVLPQGPGRSKILVTADTDWRDHLDVIVGSVADQGGVACINATAVFVEGDPAPVAEALAERLAGIPVLPPTDPGAVLPVQDVEGARAIESYLMKQTEGTRAWLGGDGIVAELGDGSAALRPAVHELDRPDAAQAGVELPFPCVWVAPWDREAGTRVLRNTLVLGTFTSDDTLVGDLLDEPTIANVYRGDHPTYWIRPGVPHDGYLGEFLMRSKTVIRD